MHKVDRHDYRNAMKSCSLLVNTSDGFSDCWDPFFKLLSIYGSGFREWRVFLNTERLDYGVKGWHIQCCKIWGQNEIQRPSWGECLIRACDKITSPVVLYVQEDYFLTAPVNYDVLMEAIALITEDSRADVVYLTHDGPRTRRTRGYNDKFEQVVGYAPYLVSTQAALWRTSALRDMARGWENGWSHEKFASVRAARAGMRIFRIRPNVENVFSYVFTGVMKGKWHVECVELFSVNGIQVDFSKRGFYRINSQIQTKLEVLKKLFSEPRSLTKSLISLI